MKLSGFSAALALLALLPADASRHKGNAMRNKQSEGSARRDAGRGAVRGAAFSETFLGNSSEEAIGGDVGDRSAMLKRLEQSLVSAGSDVASGTEDSDADEGRKTMIQAMQDMLRKTTMPKILAEHRAAQALVNRVSRGFAACSRMQRAAGRGLGAMLRTRNSIGASFKRCRKTQAARAVRAKTCTQVLVADSRAKAAACAAFKVVQKDPKKEWVVCKSSGRANYGAWVTRISRVFARKEKQYKRYKTACDKASRKASARARRCAPFTRSNVRTKATCDARQDQLEQATCAILTRTQSACQKYMPCFAQAKATSDRELRDIKKLARIRWTQWKEAQRLDCLLGHGCKASAKQIKACTRKAASKTKAQLTLRYKPTPRVPTRCPLPVPATCSSRYVAAFYAGLPQMARAKTCKPCVGLSASLALPARFKVRCAHDPAWSYVLDYSDVRSKDDIPSSRALIARGFSNSNAFYIGNTRLEKLDIVKAEICALSSRQRTRAGQCQWSCKRLASSYWGNGRCHHCGSLSTKVKKIIAALSGQMQSGYILTNINPEIARFQEKLRNIPWNCHRHRNLQAWGVGWHKAGWGISMRADHRAGQWEIGWSNNHCRYRGKLDVDTFQIRVQLKPKKQAAIMRKPVYWLMADKFDAGTNTWKNIGSKPDIRNVVRGGSLTKAQGAGNGAAKSIPYVRGTKASRLYFGNLVSSSDFTFCALTRYTGGRRGRILLGGGNWLFGHHHGRAGVAYTQRWVTAQANRKGTNWVAMCARSGTGSGNVLLDGRSIGNGRKVERPKNGEVGVNFNGGSSHHTNEVSDFAISAIMVWEGDALKMGMDYLMKVLKKGRVASKKGKKKITVGPKAQNRQSQLSRTMAPRAKDWFKFRGKKNSNCKVACREIGRYCNKHEIKKVTLERSCSTLKKIFGAGNCRLCSPSNSINRYCFPGKVSGNFYRHTSFSSSRGFTCDTTPDPRVQGACPCAARPNPQPKPVGGKWYKGARHSGTCNQMCASVGKQCNNAMIRAATLDRSCSAMKKVFGNLRCGVCSPATSTNRYCFPGKVANRFYFHTSFARNGFTCNTRPDPRVEPMCPCTGGVGGARKVVKWYVSRFPSKPNCATMCARRGKRCDNTLIRVATLQSNCATLRRAFGAGRGAPCRRCSPSDSTNTYCFPGWVGRGFYYHSSFNSRRGFTCQTKPDSRVRPACPCY